MYITTIKDELRQDQVYNGERVERLEIEKAELKQELEELKKERDELRERHDRAVDSLQNALEILAKDIDRPFSLEKLIKNAARKQRL